MRKHIRQFSETLISVFSGSARQMRVSQNIKTTHGCFCTCKLFVSTSDRPVSTGASAHNDLTTSRVRFHFHKDQPKHENRWLTECQQSTNIATDQQHPIMTTALLQSVVGGPSMDWTLPSGLHLGHFLWCCRVQRSPSLVKAAIYSSFM